LDKRLLLAKEGRPDRTASYTRVSKYDQQRLDLQLEAMTAYISDRDWSLARPVKDDGPGARGCARRETSMKAARRREIDVVEVWRLDRRGRSVADLMMALRELTDLGAASFP
jgi:DNA invertase Pin-like site-specific DNA recombinase